MEASKKPQQVELLDIKPDGVSSMPVSTGQERAKAREWFSDLLMCADMCA